MNKIILVFTVGLLEQILYTSYLISLTKRQLYLSSLLMFVYMLLYLFLIAWAIKDDNTTTLLLTYAMACCVGNFIRIKYEKYKKL